jgi:hypothetical protein
MKGQPERWLEESGGLTKNVRDQLGEREVRSKEDCELI